jgi:hypothetical protein
MKAFKFFVTLLSAVMTAYSPASWAAMDVAQKNEFNRRIKEEYATKGKTYSDLYRDKGHLFDDHSRSVLEAWLSVNGSAKVAAPVAQTIKDKNGNESVKILLTLGGKTLTLTLSPTDPDNVDINGVKIAKHDLPSIATVIQKLSEKDTGLKPLFQAIKTAQVPASKKSNMISYSLFDRLTAVKKVEYMMRLRETIEAAHMVVVDAGAETASLENAGPLFVLHPLFASLIAMAATKVGDTCIVAGNISVYEKTKSRLACTPFPKNPADFSPPAFHKDCDRSQGDVACNPLLYGVQTNGKPFCVNSAKVREFTRTATLQCNNKSPLAKDPDSAERRADYERILKSYFGLKNGRDAEKIKDCFNETHKADPSCASYFKPQLDGFKEFISKATEICGPLESGKVGAADQPGTCVELKKRALDLQTFLEEEIKIIDLKPAPVNVVDVDKEACSKLKDSKWVESERQCYCADGERAMDSLDESGTKIYTCPVKAVAPVVPPPVVEEKDTCTKENGEKSYSIKCAPLLWLGGLAAILAIAFWPKDKPSNPPPPTVLPPPTTVVVDPTPTPTVPPPPRGAEGGTGANGGSSGGIRVPAPAVVK